MNIIAQAAKEFIDTNIPVFPCYLNKKPATRAGFKDATTNIKAIESWFGGNSERLLAFPTGVDSNILVLDVDNKKGHNGSESLQLLEAVNTVLPATTIVSTTTGGFHYYFRMPDGIDIRNSANQLGDGLDIRANGGYVIAPPSTTATGAYEWVSQETLAELPEWLLELIRPQKKVRAPTTLNAVANDDLSAGLYEEPSREAMEDMLASIQPEGDIWLNTTMALQSMAAPWAREVWESWSKQSPSYDQAENDKRWDSMVPNKGITVGSIVYYAKKGGWSRKPDTGEGNYILKNVVTLASGRYYDTAQKIEIPNATALNNYHNRFVIFDDDNAISPSLQLNKYNGMVATGLCWQPTTTYEPVITFHGKPMVNTFDAPKFVVKEGDIAAWLTICRYILGEYFELVMDHMAFTLQHPEIKITWQVLIWGSPRTGKTSVIRPLIDLLANVGGVVTSAELKAGWGDSYAGRKALLFEEIYGIDKTQFNGIKDKLANDNIESLNRKGGSIIQQQNLYSIYMLSNHGDAIEMDSGENKLLVIKSPDDYIKGGDSKADMSDENREFYKELAELKRTDGFKQGVAHYLLNRDVTDFSYGYLPMRTTALAEMCHAGKGDFYHYIEELMVDRKYMFIRDVIIFDQLRNHLRMEGYKFGGDKGLKTALNEMGWAAVHGQKKVKGTNLHIRGWTLSNHVAGMSARQIYDFIAANSPIQAT